MMRMIMAAMMVVALAAGAVTSRGDVTVTEIVSMKDAQDDFAAGRYPDCLKKIGSVLGMPATTPADRAALLSLRAECLLAQKQAVPASDAFLAASNAYAMLKDSKEAATAKATSGLISASPGFSYTFRTGDKAVLPIIDPAARPAALTAYFKDQLAATQDVYKALQAKPALADIVNYSPKVQDLDGLEMAATGDDKQTATIQKGLATLAKNAMEANLTASGRKADAVAASAAQMVNAPMAAPVIGPNGQRVRNSQQPKQEKGLTEADKTTLNGLLTEVAKVPAAAKTLVPALNLDADYYKTETTNAAALTTKIEAIQGGNFKPGA